MADLFDHIAALRREGQSFAVAVVVGRRAPVSAHLGDRAIVYADGRMEGFIGGACSREIVRQQALDSLRTRRGRLVSIRPDAGAGDATDAEHVVVHMSCASEGAVDVFVEPFGQARGLVVVGATPIADAVARLGRGMNYGVVRVVDARERPDIEPDASALGMTVVTLDALAEVVRAGGPDRAAVVASQGHYDEEALENILRFGAFPYVGLVASRARGATVRAWLEERAVPAVATVRNPAGLDLGAREPNEVALSILAEIVQSVPSQLLSAAAETSAADRAAAGPPPGPASALDPVCGMTVDVAAARHSAEVDGVVYYFCCPHCRASFVKDPQQYLSQTP